MVPRCDSTTAGYFKKINLLIICVFYTSFTVISGQAKNEEKPHLRERMFFGGSLGLQFGTYTDIHVAPIVGLWVRPRIAVAAGPNFTYYKGPDYNGLDNETTMYGGNVYAEFVPVRDINNAIPIGLHMGIFLHLEDELLSLESAYWNPQNPSDRFTVNTLDSGYALYSNPEIRISFSF
jgi:hypothetical protein